MRMLVVLCFCTQFMACATHAVRCDQHLRPINDSAKPVARPPQAAP